MSIVGREGGKGRKAQLEIPITAKQFAADWAAKRILSYDRLGLISDGLRVLAETPKGRRTYLVSDLLPYPQTFTFDNSKQLEVSVYDLLGNAISSATSTPISTQRGLTVRVPAGQTIGLTAGAAVNIKDTSGLSITADANGDLQTTPGKEDGVNNAFTQTATGVATATQMITTGTLYRELRLKNIGSNPALLGFDNTVSAATGYLLTALTGTSDEIIMYGFNANLWAFSTLGTTLAILARG